MTQPFFPPAHGLRTCEWAGMLSIAWDAFEKKICIVGISNKLADSLSCFQVSTFQQLAPANMNRLPTDIPLHLQPQSGQI